MPGIIKIKKFLKPTIPACRQAGSRPHKKGGMTKKLVYETVGKRIYHE
jgi:hypothetical protein